MIKQTTKRILAISIILNFLALGYFLAKPFINQKEHFEIANETYNAKSMFLKKKIIETITARDFDEKKYERQIKELNITRTKIMNNLSEHIEGLAKKLDQKARIELADLLENIQMREIDNIRDELFPDCPPRLRHMRRMAEHQQLNHVPPHSHD